MRKLVYISVISLVTLLAISSCKKKEDGGGTTFVDLFFPVSKDITLGQSLKDEIAKDPTEYPVLDETQYATAYAHIKRIRDEILNSGKVKHKDDFEWEVKIINKDVKNAFAAPGGYIYVYTGLIKYLETENQLAGVLAHEIAHADLRHSVNQMVKQYGAKVLLDVVLGKNQGALTEIAKGLAGKKFSRNDEAEADKFSVIYLCPTSYEADGAAGFFEKIKAEGGVGIPEFLSTHPSPDNRIEDIKAKKVDLGCTGTEKDGQYADLLSSLP